MGGLDFSVLVVFLDGHVSDFDAGHLGIGDPLYVALAQRTFEQALGVVEAEMADIRAQA